VEAVKAVQRIEVVKRSAFTEFDWWRFDARMTSPKTCPICKELDGRHYRGDRIATEFPYHIIMAVNRVKAHAHMPRDDNCRCVLIWLFRTEEVHEVYTGPFMKIALTQTVDKVKI